MANWMFCKEKDGSQVALNLDLASAIKPAKNGKRDDGTKIWFSEDKEWVHVDLDFSVVYKAANGNS